MSCCRTAGKPQNQPPSPDLPLVPGDAPAVGSYGSAGRVPPISYSVALKGDVASVVIPRNTTLPTRKINSFTTAEDNQTEITVRVYQGESGNLSLIVFRSGEGVDLTGRKTIRLRLPCASIRARAPSHLRMVLL